MVRWLIFSLLLLSCCGCGLAEPNFTCRQDAYARAAHPNVGFGTLVADAVDPPKPHPPLDQMLAACGK